MGTTLTNGVYLPDEGERNCYAGLKINWETLDQKIADITALQQAVAGALHREIVESLPTTDIDLNTIYMVLSGTSATENVYNEFMYVNNAWELIGTSATDLTNYYTKAEVDGKLLLKANASDLTSHTGDSTIHVTANDKDKWTNSANTHVLRLAKSALTPSSSTNAFSNLDDATALKVGDKVMDTAGVLFEVTAIDTANSTFTIGTALIDLAQDSDVVHKSGDEAVGGKKTFRDDLTIYNNDSSQGTKNLNISSSKIQVGDTSNSDAFGIRLNAGASYIAQILAVNDTTGTQNLQLSIRTKDNSDNFITSMVRSRLSANGNSSFEPGANDSISLGSSSFKWKSVYATNYYYGNDNVEFSTKFVTTDTDQTVSGQKVFTDINAISNSAEIGSTAGNNSFKVLDKNKKTISRLEGGTFSGGMAYSYWLVNNGTDVFNGISLYQPSANLAQLRPYSSTLSLQLGATNRYFSDCYTSKVNGVEPSSLSLPDLSKGIDISSYITLNSDSSYTPLSDGYVYICCYSSAPCGLWVRDANNNGVSTRSIGSVPTYNNLVSICIPVVKNVPLSIFTPGCENILTSKFYPCLGNV